MEQFGVINDESDVKLAKFKMAGQIWLTVLGHNTLCSDFFIYYRTLF